MRYPRTVNSEHILAQLILRSWPLKRGVGRLTDRLFGNLKFKNEVVRIRTTDGFYMHVMPNDLIGRFLYLVGEFDRDIFEILLQGGAARAICSSDIGANIGYVSACVLCNVPGSKAVAVEPQPAISDLLEKISPNSRSLSNRSRCPIVRRRSTVGSLLRRVTWAIVT